MTMGGENWWHPVVKRKSDIRHPVFLLASVSRIEDDLNGNFERSAPSRKVLSRSGMIEVILTSQLGSQLSVRLEVKK